MAFFKTIAKWTTIWTLLLCLAIVIEDRFEERLLDARAVLRMWLNLWLFMAIVVTFARIVRMMHRFSWVVVREIRTNPRRGVSAILTVAIDETLSQAA